MNTEHKPIPDTWTVVNAQDSVVIIAAACSCGDPDCGFAGNVYASDFIANPPYRTTK